ncbi:anaerobic ribonucleoside-triphosphate reductase activating protein [Caminicella sporogenes DSM 14501]|uniref:Anaerobic ribonucleoside-triphosphate reductase-activating protein n=1 Tax=Caminicella sporogenes DSM 14501 TaxID=1121266 RepID=A0A1M6QFK4_9FIRM|nr:anaerobic ribonucleoside-triphosphate reductase activating protein [Caminicella sporogenes]RKD25332.1 anaerobic ribonucleoside-triphosphate reductase activating protein [Caminicella sporogenes]WIF95329.1 anaerobic ribonucleoside-triphosphate reductase activating protein [Caminicella sporogenes]SHK18991.1 anaerobic ribonucleoside-triphosphate reductase activating protein [Caminicella sporogenes DSM 14501]
MFIRLSHVITRDSIVDGPGLRAVIWTQGCKHNCKGCHNPSTHDFNGGFLMDINDVIKEIKDLKLHRGITFSGGEPFEQPIECLEIAKAARQLGLDIWCYTGYTFEELINKNGKRYKEGWIEFLQYIDVLIDGPFILEKKNLLLKFRGSENQRILDVPKSLKYKKPLLKEEYYEIPEAAIAR